MNNTQTAIKPPHINILFPFDLFARWEAYVSCAKGEISVIGGIKRVSSNTLRITDIFLVHQRCSAGSTIFKQDEFEDFQFDLANKDYPTEDLKLWIHSHASMSAFWSSTDDENIEEQTSGDWFLSIVSNKTGEYKARLDLFNPFRLRFDDVRIIKEFPLDFITTIKEEIAEKVEEYIPTTNYPGMWGVNKTSQYTGPIKSYSSPKDKTKINDPDWQWIPQPGTHHGGFWIKVSSTPKITKENSCFKDGIPAEKSDHVPATSKKKSSSKEALVEYDYNELCLLAKEQWMNIQEFFLMEGLQEYINRDECTFYLEPKSGQWYVDDPLSYRDDGHNDVPF